VEVTFVIPGLSEGPDPESRDSGFDAAHRPGMTDEPVIASAAKQSIAQFGGCKMDCFVASLLAMTL